VALDLIFEASVLSSQLDQLIGCAVNLRHGGLASLKCALDALDTLEARNFLFQHRDELVIILGLFNKNLNLTLECLFQVFGLIVKSVTTCRGR